MMIEDEIKIRVDEHTRDRLIQLSVSTRVIDIVDFYYQDKKKEMFRSDLVLRLRRENEKVLLAYKGSRTLGRDKNVIREELETEIQNFNISKKILSGLGFSVRDIVEKKRLELQYGDYEDLGVVIDQYPFIGLYIEIEGRAKRWKEFCSEHSIDLSGVDTRNCTEIFLDHCAMNKLVQSKMRKKFTFAEERRMQR